LLWFSLSDQPAIGGGTPLSHQDIERAKTIIERNDPRGLAPGAESRIAVSEHDLNLALNYLAQKYARGGVQATVGRNHMQIIASVELPLIPARPYLNLAASVVDHGGVAYLDHLEIGSLRVPGFVAGWLTHQVAERVYGTEEYALANSMIQSLELQPGKLTVNYHWQPDTLRTLGTRLTGADGARLAVYHEHLLALQHRGVGLQGSVTPVLQEMFGLARQRSVREDPVAENRALILILGAWAGERGTRALLPQATREPLRFGLTLQRRRDLGQHFLVSAAIAASADTRLSDAVGIFKEVSDSRGGSGFSFADLAADRAGTRFGELATGSREGALRVQARLGQDMTEADIMPRAGDLPEGMTEAAFKRRYTAVGSAQYQRVVEEIERRIAACRLYRG
jgi:hypothetical protein